MGEKLLRLMKSEGLTSSRLAEILETGASNISHIISGRSKPGYDLLRKILLRFPQINPDWLLLDAETMYRLADSSMTDNSVSADLFTTESTTTAHTENAPHDANSAGGSNPAAVTDPNQINSDIFRNMTSSTIQRVIVIYSDRTFESFTPKQE